MPDVSCPLPKALIHTEAKSMFDRVRKEMPGLTSAAIRREAARRLGVDYDTFLKAWKAKPKSGGVIPGPKPPDPPVVQPPIPTPVSTHKVSVSTRYAIDDERTIIESAGKDPIEELGLYTEGTDVIIVNGTKAAKTLEGVIDVLRSRGGFTATIKELDEIIVKIRGGAPKTPPPPPTPPVPGGPLANMTKEAARKYERETAKKFGLTPGSAEARRKAAEELGVRYDDFLAVWKGQKPKVTTPGKPTAPVDNPAPPTLTPKPTPTPKDKTKSTYNERNIDKILKGKGFKSSTKVKERQTHRGESYGGGTGESAGYKLSTRFDGTIEVTYSPGMGSGYGAVDDFEKILDGLRAEGFNLEMISPLKYRIVKEWQWSDADSVRVVAKRATTKEEAGGFLSDYFKRKVIGIKAAVPVRDELRKQLDYVGEVAKARFNGVRHVSEDTVQDGVKYMKENPNTLAYYWPGYGEGRRAIQLGDRVLGGHQFTRKSLQMQKTRWKSQCTTHKTAHGEHDGVLNTFAHEFGHFVDDMAKSHKAREYSDMVEVIIKDLGVDVDPKAVQQFRFGHHNDFTNPLLRSKIRREVSNYGSTNTAEFFAEVWAEYTRAGDNARPLIKKWGTMLQDLMEDL